MERRIRLDGEAATARLAETIAQSLRPGDCILLSGPLGAGKTVFARGAILSILPKGASQEVPSPSYTIVQTYETRHGPLWHADLFRLSDPEETIELGLTEAIPDTITLVEWPERLGDLVPARHLAVDLAIDPVTDARMASLTPAGTDWNRITDLAR